MKLFLATAIALASLAASTTFAQNGTVLSGRILDERGTPWTNAPIEVTVDRYSPYEPERRPGPDDRQRLRTDGNGRFTWPIRVHWIEGTRLFFSFERSIQEEPWRVLGESTCEHSRVLKEGTADLGDVVVPSFPPAPWTGLDDAAILQRLATTRERWRTLQRGRREWESTLLEAARRGGAKIERELERQLAEVRKSAGRDALHVEDLQPLIALRRAQRKPDPLELRCLSDTSTEVTWPASPTFAFELVNRDAGGESFQITVGGSYRSGRFARVAVDARDATGALLPPRAWRSLMGGGMFGRRTLAPAKEGNDSDDDDDAVRKGPRFAVPVDAFVAFPGPGEFTLRVLLHDDVTIADYGAEGYVVSASSELHVHLRPLVVELSRAELAEIRGWVKQIDATEVVPAIARPWSADLEYVGEPKTAQDRLFRAGWRSVPALIEALDDASLTPRHRGWVLGLLAAITGHGGAGFPGAGMGSMEFGPTVMRMNWPTTKQGSAEGARGYGSSTGDPWPDRQRAAVEEWHGLKPLFELHLCD